MLDWYVRTPWWKLIRAAKLEENGEKCERCGRQANTVFHKHFATLGKETTDDLIVLCKPCRTW